MKGIKNVLKFTVLFYLVIYGILFSSVTEANAQSNNEKKISASGSIIPKSSATIVDIVFDDEDGFWATDGGGTGSLGIIYDMETGIVTSGSSSQGFEAINGPYSYVNIQHGYPVAQDWSGYDNLAFYWYGQNSGTSFTVKLESPTNTDRFVETFVDDFTGWRKIVLPLSGFTAYGSADLSNVKKISISYSGTARTNWYIDKMTLESAVVDVVFDDEDGFWATDGGGTGSLGIIYDMETGIVTSGSSSQGFEAINGPYSYVNIQHGYPVAQDWSGYDNLAFYWYGQNSGTSFTVKLESPTNTDRFVETFVDDFTGWRKIVLPLSGFTAYGSADLSNVKKISISYSGTARTNWYIDKMTLESGGTTPPPTPTPTPVEEFKVLRWTGARTYADFYPSIDYNDGYAIGQRTDIYHAWHWLDKAIEGIVANDKEIIVYFNIAARTESSTGFSTDWRLLDENGEEIRAKSFPQSIMVDPLNEDFRAFVVSFVQGIVDDGFTGIFWDNGFTPYAPVDYYWSSPAVNPRTGQLYTDEEWVRDKVDLLNYMKQQFPEMLMVSNGCWNGKYYYDHVEGFDYFFENALIEGLFWEGTFSSIPGRFWTPSRMEMSMTAMVEQQTKWLSKPDKLIVTSTQVRGAGSYDQPVVGVLGGDRAAKLTFCSGLMGVSASGNVFGLNDYMGDPDAQALFQIDLGNPIGPYSKIGETTYMRQFENVVVLANVGSYAETVLVNGVEMTIEPLTGEII